MGVGEWEWASGSGRVGVGEWECEWVCRICRPWLTLCKLGTNYASDSLKVSGKKNTFYPNQIL